MLRKIFFCLILFFVSGFYNYADAGSSFFRIFQSENKEIDSLINVADNLYQNEDYDGAFIVYEKIIEKSKDENYSKGLTKAYLGYAGIYFIKGKLDISTSYLIKAKKEPYTKESTDDMYSILFREGLNLHSLGLYGDAIKKYREALTLSSTIPDKEDRINKSSKIHINIGDIYQSENIADSALYYYKNAYYSSTTNLNNKFTSSISISELHIENGELDSARRYLGFAQYYVQKLNSDYSDALFNEINGKYYNASGEVQNAISAYQKSLSLNNELNRPKPQLYKLLAEAYQKKGETVVSNDYLKRYVEVKDSLDESRKQNLNVPVLLAKTDNANKLEKAESNTRFIVIASFLLLGLLFMFAYFYVRRQKKKSLQGKRENIQLKKKLNNAFEEVVDLAMTNSPNFLSRFIEVYPEFYNQLITHYPNLTTADLKLCALMKLDFSTKEIAEINYSSLRTVQNRKYKLRKKFHLSTEENINQWIQNMHIESLTHA